MAKTQIETITKYLVSGRKLTALSCYELCGSLRMSAHAFQIEKKHGISLVKKDMKGKNRYGNVFTCTVYSIHKSDRIKVRQSLKTC